MSQELNNNVTLKITPLDLNNPLILTLNDDCLLQILSYLSIPEWISLGLTHPRYQSLIKDHGLPGNSVDLSSGFLCEYPLDTHSWVYQGLGMNTTTLTSSNVNESDLTRLFPLFPKLQHLQLHQMRLTDMTKIPDYPHLESLKLDGVTVDRKYLLKLFKHLKGALKCLDFGHDLPKALEAVHDLREMHMCNQALTKDMTTFWKQNAGIERLYIGETDSFDWKEMKRLQKMCANDKNQEHVKQNYQAFDGLQGLTFLHFRHLLYEDLQMFFGAKFELRALRELLLWTYKGDTATEFLAHVGPELRVFRSECFDYKIYDPFGLERFPLLESLEVQFDFFMEDDLPTLKNLQRFVTIDSSSSTVLWYVRELPKLRELTMDTKPKEWQLEDKFEQPLKEFLRQNGRELLLNGRKY